MRTVCVRQTKTGFQTRRSDDDTSQVVQRFLNAERPAWSYRDVVGLVVREMTSRDVLVKKLSKCLLRRHFEYQLTTGSNVASSTGPKNLA